MNNRLTYSIYNLTQHKSACTFAVSDDHRLTTKEIVDHRHNTGADALTDCFYQITINMLILSLMVNNSLSMLKAKSFRKVQALFQLAPTCRIVSRYVAMPVIAFNTL